MEGFGIVSACFGMMGFIFSLAALAKAAKLEGQLRDAGLLGSEAGVEQAPSTDDSA